MKNILLSICFLLFACCHFSSADSGKGVFFEPEFFPIKLVVDAGGKARSFSDDKLIQTLYLSGYREGALDNLIYGESQHSDEFIKKCSSSNPESSYARICGYQSGFAATNSPGTPNVSLYDFGYGDYQGEGEISIKDGLLTFTPRGTSSSWLIVPQTTSFQKKEGEYKITGVVSMEGNYGQKGMTHTKQIVLKTFRK
jgi:hypothetical protein